jgi:hypothetical protein
VTLAAADWTKFDGTQSLADSTAILHVAGSLYGTDIPQNGQNAIMAFVNAGGTYIGTEWIGYMVSAYKYLQSMLDLVLMLYDGTSTPNGDLKPVAGQENNPLLEGITFPAQIQANTVLFGKPVNFDKNLAQPLIADPTGLPILLERNVGSGHAVNFLFPSSDPALASQAIQRIILNAANL